MSGLDEPDLDQSPQEDRIPTPKRYVKLPTLIIVGVFYAILICLVITGIFFAFAVTD